MRCHIHSAHSPLDYGAKAGSSTSIIFVNSFGVYCEKDLTVLTFRLGGWRRDWLVMPILTFKVCEHSLHALYDLCC